jgi:hypothetical protein
MMHVLAFEEDGHVLRSVHRWNKVRSISMLRPPLLGEPSCSSFTDPDALTQDPHG